MKTVPMILLLCALVGSQGAAADPASARSPDDGGPRNWEVAGVATHLNLRAQPTTAAAVVARLAPGTVLDNLGCRQAEGRTWCYVQPLGGGPVGHVAARFLKPAVSPDGSVATGPDDSALRAGRGQFDATGLIPGSQLEFGVARAGGGYATVVILRPDGPPRTVYFRMGRAIGAGTSEADNPGAFRAERQGDMTIVRIGPERYEIPDEVVLGPTGGPPAQLLSNPLPGTSWRLVEIQSMSDAQGTRSPHDATQYTMELRADGTVAMRLNCNRATGTWTSFPAADGSSGRFEFGPLAGTRALCPPPSLDEEITRQAQYIRGYLIRDGRLHLSLMADGGIWSWSPAATDTAATAAPSEGTAP